MGNENSTPAPPRPANKLSKPRTNSSLPLRSPVPNSRRNSNLKESVSAFSKGQQSSLSVDNVVVDEDARKGGREAPNKERKRMSIFRSKSSQARVSQLEIPRSHDIEFLDESRVRSSEAVVAEQWSRNSSVVEFQQQQHYNHAPMQRPQVRTARMSLQHVPYAQHHPRLSLVPEAPSPKPDSMYRRQSILPDRENSKRHSMVPAQAQSQTPPSPQNMESPQLSQPLSIRTNSDTQLYTPIRRRSLLQHGVATRSSWVENDARQTLPSQQNSPHDDLQNYYYNPAKPTCSPLTELATMLPRFPNHGADAPRAQTPNDFDYGHIGAFKLGSLRITNGAASPVPSLETPGRRSGDDYVSAGNAHNKRHMKKRSQTFSAVSDSLNQPWAAKSELPALPTHPKLESLTIDTHLPLPEFALFKFTEGHSRQRSLNLAQSYQDGLAMSPFSFDNSPHVSPKLEATSKHTAMEDDLFEAEPLSPELIRAPRSFDSGYPAEEISTVPVSKVVKGPKELTQLTPKPLAKADSGYSSNVSLRSFKGTQAPSVPAKEPRPAPPIKPVRAASSTYSIKSESSNYSVASNATVRQEHPLPALPFLENLPAPLWRKSWGAPAKKAEAPSIPPKLPALENSLEYHQYLRTSDRKVSEPVLATRIKSTPSRTELKHGRTRSSSGGVFRISKENRTSNHSPSGSDASSNGSSKWRRRSSSSRSQSALQLPQQPIFTVQASRATDTQLNHNIPAVPLAVEKHLEQRVNSFPLNGFPNTFNGDRELRKTSSKETLTTIFSVGSMEWKDELTASRLLTNLPPVPPTIVENPLSPGLETTSRRHTYQPKPSPSPAPAPAPAPIQTRKPITHRQSYQPVSNTRNFQPAQTPRDNPALRQKIQRDFETEIMSFKNISSGLGKSPYDAAISADKSKSMEQERAKTITAQFEADAAARFAKKRHVQEHVVHHASSYDAIPNLPFTPGHKRVSSPPSVNQNRGSPVQFQRRSNPSLRPAVEEKQAAAGRMKSSLPVAMQTQPSSRVIALAPPTPAPEHLAPSPPPSRAAPKPPTQTETTKVAPSVEKENDSWATQRDYWTLRKADALKTRKSLDMQRSAPAPQNQGILIKRPDSAGESLKPEWLRKKVSFEGTPLSRSEQKAEKGPRSGNVFRSWSTEGQRWDGYGSPPGQWSPPSHSAREVAYDHTYGNYDHQQGGNHHEYQVQDEEYYDGPEQNEDWKVQEQMMRNSTQDMLSFDPAANYGPYPGRKSTMNMEYSEIPVLPRGKIYS